ncbi:hypothetical protein PMAYCL1PPCAC_05610, partial [Pristionchus mayeri]
VECKVLDAPSGAVGSHRPGKGIIQLGTMNTPGLKSSKACLSVFTAAGKEHKYPLDGSIEVETIHDRFIDQGKLTIVWREPRRTILISDAKPTVLRNFVDKFRAALRGENIESLKEIIKEKKSDLGGPVSLAVTKKENYPKTFSTATLKTLVISGIDRKAIDGRWFSCTHLTTLDLSRNQLGAAPDFEKMKNIAKLVNLQDLTLSRNRLAEPAVRNRELRKRMAELAEVFTSLPPSLLRLDLSFNGLRWMPPLGHLPSLERLDLANNRLTALPHELRHRTKLSLNLDNNQIKFLPVLRSNQRQTFSITGNPLDQPAMPPRLTDVKCPSLHQLAMQSVMRNRIRIETAIKVRFWEGEGTDFCDYCGKWFAADALLSSVYMGNAAFISVHAAHNTHYPTRAMSCTDCYKRRYRPRNPPAAAAAAAAAPAAAGRRIV